MSPNFSIQSYTLIPLKNDGSETSLPTTKLQRKNGGESVKSYTDLFNGKKIEIIYNCRRELSALMYTLDHQGNIIKTSLPLPLVGLSKEVKHLKNVDQLRRFFAHTHLIPEKGNKGEFNRVSVHLSAKGGVKGKIPFQPGLAVGSVVRGETLEQMEKYASQLAKEEAILDQMKAVEQRIGELQTKINALNDSKKEKSTVDKVYLSYWETEVKALTARLTELVGELNKLPKKGLPTFENFQQAVETPIDTANSKLEVQPRGFDSLNFSSQYINMSEDNSEIHDRIEQTSSAVSGSVTAGGWWFMPSGNASHSWSKTVSDRLFKIKASKIAQGVLVINAVVTTRHVRCFTNLTYNKDKVRNILEAMKSTNKESLRRYGITTSKNEDGEEVKEIYLLTEAVLGGSFTALVTFLDEQHTNRDLHKHAEERNNTTSGGATLGGWFAKSSIAASYNNQSGQQTEDDVLKGITSTKVNIEILSQGALPTFTRNIIEHEITKHLDLNPSKFELSKRDEDDAKTLTTGQDQEKYEALVKRQMKMENAQIALLNTYRGLTSTKDTQTIHTPNSVMGAYENFSKQMTSDQDCGIPIGFNYTILSQARLTEIYNELNSPSTTPNNANSSSSNANSSSLPNTNKEIEEKQKDEEMIPKNGK